MPQATLTPQERQQATLLLRAALRPLPLTVGGGSSGGGSGGRTAPGGPPLACGGAGPAGGEEAGCRWLRTRCPPRDLPSLLLVIKVQRLARCFLGPRTTSRFWGETITALASAMVWYSPMKLWAWSTESEYLWPVALATS